MNDMLIRKIILLSSKLSGIVYDSFKEDARIFEGFNIFSRVLHNALKFTSSIFEVPIMPPSLLIFPFSIGKWSANSSSGNGFAMF